MRRLGVVLLAPLALLATLLLGGAAQQTAATCTSLAPVDTNRPGGVGETAGTGRLPAGPGGVGVDAAQLGNARIITGVAAQRRLPARAAVIAVAAANTESDLRNQPNQPNQPNQHGQPGEGRGGYGLYQQQPGAGWGTAAQLLDPVHATRQFLHLLDRVPGWEVLPPGHAAAKVLARGDPARYAAAEPLATALVDAALGRTTTLDGCLDDHAAGDPDAGDPGGYPPERMGPEGLTPRTRAAMLTVAATFGVTDIGGYCPGGCTTGHIPGSDHYTGHAVDIMLLPITPASRAHGDRIAGWLVANAGRLAVKQVIWNAQVWTARRAGDGWRPYTHPSGSTNPTLAHRDHIHLGVY